MPEQRDARRLVELAAVTGAHGVSGEVRLKLFGEGVKALSAHSAFNDGALTLKKVRADSKGGAVARFAEISNRSDAEQLRGTVLTVSRDDLPALGEDEYYHADLIGLAVYTDAGEYIGTVIAVHNFGATDIIEIKKEPVPAKGARTLMVPVTEKAVIEWDSEKVVIAADFAED
ncbi:ribosome maturation factor RimM [Erythrobacter sp. THAF29]|uniref:ribosome maturation factor RimM n=1 Tax=Erythrobacter sp. THAF29 TaxID=2587851 RepID=UPI0012683DFA|nr:ribosome maturation factor RimM [Erythrobacter sp. THAF29]QFT78148.1 Ribosome maturation factor RimM [Erythrobacter sp. THAF29]